MWRFAQGRRPDGQQRWIERRPNGFREGSPLRDLDSIQIANHKEFYSAERKFEILLLREAECAPFRAMRHVKCGRYPFLFAPDSSRCQRAFARQQQCTSGRSGRLSGSMMRLGVRRQDCNAESVRARAYKLWAGARLADNDTQS